MHPAELVGNLSSGIWTTPQPSALQKSSSLIIKNKSVGKTLPLSQLLWLLLRCPLSKLAPCCSFISMTCFLVYKQFFLKPCDTILPRGKAVSTKVLLPSRNWATEKEKKIQRKNNKLISQKLLQRSLKRKCILYYIYSSVRHTLVRLHFLSFQIFQVRSIAFFWIN